MAARWALGELNRRTIELSTIYEVGRILSAAGDLQKALPAALRVLHSFLGLADGAVVVQDRGHVGLRALAALGPRSGDGPAPTLPADSLAAQILRLGLPVVVPDVRGDPQPAEPSVLPKPEGYGHALLGVPIRIQGDPAGVLIAHRGPREAWGGFHGDLRVLTAVAALIGQAIRAERPAQAAPLFVLGAGRPASTGAWDHARTAPGIVGQGKRMREVFEAVRRVSRSGATVLLRGESGTGKELVARAIHGQGPRAAGPFITLNCAALPETLLESELFGHERGAFTGALQARKGRFELADRGTLFLDEIGEMPLGTQAKLLRVIQDKRFERLGGTRTLSVDVRIIAATNRHLEGALDDGTFREDLYYRLNVLPIFLPPLRERREDIPALVEHFLARFNAEDEKDVRITGRTLQALLDYPWPGNVRELENVIERLVVLATRKLVFPEDLPSVITTMAREEAGRRRGAVGGRRGLPAGTAARPAEMGLREMERQAVLEALGRARGVQARAAELLGITPRQIRYRLRKFGIVRAFQVAGGSAALGA